MRKARRRWALPAVVLAASVVVGAKAAHPPPADVPDDPDHKLNKRIDESLKKGINSLLGRAKNAAGEWDNPTESAFVLYVLLDLGRSFDEPKLDPNGAELKPVVTWLVGYQPQTATEASFKALALCRMRGEGAPGLQLSMTQTRDALLKLVRTEGSVSSRTGSTTLNTTETHWAYAALAELEDAGLEIDPEIWKSGEQFWCRNQKNDGGWPDIRTLPNTDPTSTAAAMAALYLIGGRHKETREKENGSGPAAALTDTVIALGLKKLQADFTAKTGDFYYLYCFERAASAAGLRVLAGGVDWYRATAPEILGLQRADGSWAGMPAAGLPGDKDAYATAFAMMFLSLGRAPVPFNKLEYPRAAGHWNDRPRDVARLTEWLSQQSGFERPLNWQTVSLTDAADKSSGRAGWGEAPILVITGSGDPEFTAEDIQKLREFVLAGGLIFSSADNGDAAFTNAIVKKYARQVADGRYEMRALPQTHELFGDELRSPPQILGLSNDVREWWVHSPVDMGASWQGRKFSAKDHFNFPASVVRYATGNGPLRNRLEGLAEPGEKGSEKLPVTRTIQLARLDYAGNPDPEPGAWPRLAGLAPKRFHTAVQVATVPIAKLDFTKTPIAHMTGTTGFTLNAEELAALKQFLEAGGTLIADSAGSSPKFTASFSELMLKLYPDTPAAELPINDQVFNGSIADSVRITDVSYRKFGMKEQPAKARIQAVTINARHVILFLPEDMTSGLLGTDTGGVKGYAPDSAAALARNLLLYAAGK